MVNEGQIVPGGIARVCRRDVARFMLDTAEAGTWKKTCVAVTASWQTWLSEMDSSIFEFGHAHCYKKGFQSKKKKKKKNCRTERDNTVHVYIQNCRTPALKRHLSQQFSTVCINDKCIHLQSTLVISTSLISNNRLSRSENLIPVLTWKYNSRWQNIVEKLISGVKLHNHLWNVVVRFIISSILQLWYVEVRIFLSFSESLSEHSLDFEIHVMRVDCIFITVCVCAVWRP